MRRQIWNFVIVCFLCGSAFAGNGNLHFATSVATDSGKPILSVTNNYTEPITGFVMTVNPYGYKSDHQAHDDIYYDIFINYLGDDPIPTGSSRQRPVAFIEGTPYDDLRPTV